TYPTGLADDHLTKPGEERSQQDEAGAHLGGGLERDEQPLDVARGDFVDVVRWVFYDNAKIAQRLGHDPDILDLGDVGQPAALPGQGGGGEQLEGRILGAADRD